MPQEIFGLTDLAALTRAMTPLGVTVDGLPGAREQHKMPHRTNDLVTQGSRLSGTSESLLRGAK